MNQQMYQLMALHCGDKKEKIIGLLMKEFNLTERTAETYYYKWKKDFMKMKTDAPDPKLATKKPVENVEREPTKEEVKEEVKPVETKPTQEDVIKALEVIKNVCKGCECCEECPFGNIGSDCSITDALPKNWNIKNPPLLRYLV